MVRILIFVNNQSDLNSIDFAQFESIGFKVFSFNYRSHKALEEKNIKHEIAENYIDREERLKIFDKVASLHEWYKQNSFKEFEINGINVLGLLDSNEFQSHIITELLNFLIIKRIIEKESPEKIITTTDFLNILKALTAKIEVLAFSASMTKNLYWDKITIKLDIGKFLLSFNISNKTYQKIRSLWEDVMCKIFNLWLDAKNYNKKTILFLEFNPTLFPELLSNLKKLNRNLLFFNRRRTAVWSLESIKILRHHNGKLIDFKKLLNKDERNEITLLYERYLEKLKLIWSNNYVEFSQYFAYNGESFWPCVKDVLYNSYKNRLYHYITLAFLSKNIIEKINISCILSLNEIGETEKSILATKKNIPFVLLQHGFANYVSETSRFDILGSYSNFKDKIAVWSHYLKKYLVEQRGIDSNRILVTGSPKHDLFVERKNQKKAKLKKTILIGPYATNEVHGQADTNLHIKVENLIKNICLILKKIPNVDIIVKLHPMQLTNNDDIKKMFNDIDRKIPVYTSKSVIKIIESVDAVVVISPEGFGTSSMILESILLEKPTMNIVIGDTIYPFQYVKDGAVLTASDKDDLSKKLYDVLFDFELRNNLIDNGKKFIQNYLTNYGTASENLARLLSSY